VTIRTHQRVSAGDVEQFIDCADAKVSDSANRDEINSGEFPSSICLA